DAEEGVLDLSALLELVGDLLRRVDRHREADPDRAVSARGRDLRVDADHATVAVDQRTAGVAGVDRRIGLDDMLDRESVRSLELALQRADDPGRDRAIEA